MKKYLLPVIACLGLVAMSCSENDVNEPDPPVGNEDKNKGDDYVVNPDDYPKTLDFLYFFADENEKKQISAISGLTLTLAENMDDIGKGNGNITFSPIAQALNLVIVANAADAAYQQRVSRIVGGYDFDEITATASKVAAVLPDNKNGAFLTLASSMWVDTPWAFSDDYLKRMDELFGAAGYSLDFTNPASADFINSWCSEKTHGIINYIVDAEQLKRQSAMWLTSLYFMGEWSDKFDKEQTREADFHTPGGDVKVQMMHTDLAPGGYYELIDGYECAKIDFAGHCQFKIVLPPADMPIGQAAAGMSAAVKDFLMEDRLQSIDRLHLDMPRFTCANYLDFTDLYKKLGIDMDGAVFPALNAGKPIGTNIVQNASISIDEDGAKGGAVAATIIAWATAETPQPKDIYLTLDRPFFFYITNNTTGAIIFAGRVANP